MPLAFQVPAMLRVARSKLARGCEKVEALWQKLIFEER